MTKFSLPVWVLLVSSVGWGLTWLPLHHFEASGLAGPSLVFISFASAVILLMPVLISQRHDWWGQVRYMLLIAIFGGFANLLFQLALYYGDVVRVMILFYLLPVWSVLGGRIFLGENIDLLRLMTLAAAISGGVLILGGLQILQKPPGWVDLMAIGSGFAFAMNNLVFRASQELPLGSKVGSMFLGVVLLIGGFLIIKADTSLPSDTGVIGYAALYGIAWLMLITFGTQWGVTRLEAGRASIIIVMELVVAVISSVIILSQSLSMSEISGALLVIAAAILEGFREESLDSEVAKAKVRVPSRSS